MRSSRAPLVAAAIGVVLQLVADPAQPAVSRLVWMQLNAVYAFNLKPDAACQAYARQADAITGDASLPTAEMQARLQALWISARPCFAPPRTPAQEAPHARPTGREDMAAAVRRAVRPAPPDAAQPIAQRPSAATAPPAWPAAGNDLAAENPGLTAAEREAMLARAAQPATLPPVATERAPSRVADGPGRAHLRSSAGPVVKPLPRLVDIRAGVRESLGKSLPEAPARAPSAAIAGADTPLTP